MTSHEEVKELSDRFEAHRIAFEDVLAQEPSDDEKRDALQEAEEAIETLSTILVADDEELVKYEDMLTELAEKEQKLSELLGR